jgi:aminoglycoside phosphotransferase
MTSGLTQREADVDEELARHLRALGRDPDGLRAARRLAGGASGSGVFRLAFDDGSSAVLKVTTRPAWRPKAQREARFYDELAPSVPVRVPRLLASAESGPATCLLLSAAAPAPTPLLWGDADWLRVARDLGALHGSAGAGQLDRLRWLSRPRRVPADEVRAAVAAWTRLGCGRLALSLLGQRRALDRALDALPVGLIHGDCHTGNLLVDDSGEFCWADWQEVGVGHGPEDLALLWQRAEFGGAVPPRQAMLDAYLAARGLPSGPTESTDPGAARAAVAAELRLLLLDWPSYLVGADDDARERLIRRFRELSSAWAREEIATTAHRSTLW